MNQPYRFKLIWGYEHHIYDTKNNITFVKLVDATFPEAYRMMHELNERDEFEKEMFIDDLIAQQIRRMGISTIGWAKSYMMEPVTLEKITPHFREDWQKWHKQNQEYFEARMQEEIQKELNYGKNRQTQA